MKSHPSDLTLGFHKDQPIILPADQRLKHTHISGLTGAGKSRYLEYLIRQDLRAWPWTKRGMVVIDPHGEVVNGIMNWVSANELTHLPIVPIDFNQKDQIVSYNVLRQRAGEPSVIVDNIVKAMAYVWGKGGTDETPLFERWCSNLLYALYGANRTLADAAHLFTPEGLVIAENIVDPMIRRDWLWARRNRKDFETATSSSVNRFRRFLLNPMLRSMFGQTDRSLDLRTALDDGQIILVSLARNGGNISRENADLFATLLLADLWASADERGKSEGVKPFWVYVDEFQRFVTPTMAENLAEARGFGLGMTLSNQFPLQILDGGPYGERTYNEVMENTRTKVVFRLRTRANLLPVAESLFMDTFDPEQVKYQHYSTKVTDHRLSYLPSLGTTSTHTAGGGEQQSRSIGRSRAESTNWSHADTSTHTVGTSESHTDGENIGLSSGTSRTVSDGESDSDQWSQTEGESFTDGSNWSDGESNTTGANHNRSRSANVSLDLGEPTDDMKRRLSRGGRRPDYHALTDNSDGYGKHQGVLADATKRVGVSETLASASGENQSRSLSRARGGSESESRQNSMTKGGSRGQSRSLSSGESDQLSISATSSDTFGISESFAEGTTDSFGGSETFGTNEAETTGTSSQWSDANGSTVTWSPMLFPIMGKEAEAPMFRSIEEQIFIAMARIARLRDREAYVLTVDMRTPLFIRTPEVKRSNLSRICVQACIAMYQAQSGLMLSLAVAYQHILDRDAEFSGIYAVDDEDFSPRHRIEAVVKTVVPPVAAT